MAHKPQSLAHLRFGLVRAGFNVSLDETAQMFTGLGKFREFSILTFNALAGMGTTKSELQNVVLLLR